MSSNMDRYLQSMEKSGLEEIVTVDTRALIDKVLARYSADFTTFRELIQNAADARASRVTIRIETVPSTMVPVPTASSSSRPTSVSRSSPGTGTGRPPTATAPSGQADQSTRLKHIIQHHTVHKVTISNNGLHFRPEDWARLKNIAEGNPDETKIGAFGVGFYSVFADCEEPFVVSGHRALRFFWKQNRLFTKALDIDKSEPAADTTFVLVYRDQTTAVPDLKALCRFFCSSFTFVALSGIDLWLDDFHLFSLDKSSTADKAVSIPSSISTATQDEMLTIIGLRHRSGQISARWINAIVWAREGGERKAEAQEQPLASLPSLRSLFGRLTKSAATKKREEQAEVAAQTVADHVTEYSSATVGFRLTAADIVSKVNVKFATELERATKKAPPRRAVVEVLSVPSMEQEKREAADSKSPSRALLPPSSPLAPHLSSFTAVEGLTSEDGLALFEDVLPHNKGRIYIGFPTSQTTGFKCHLSIPSVIPTVERESIDLNARYVSTWNSNMLAIAGTVCRIAYVGEMGAIQAKLTELCQADMVKDVQPEQVEKITPAVLRLYDQFTSVVSTPFAAVGEKVQAGFWGSGRSGSIDVLSTRGIVSSSKVRLCDQSITFVKSIPLVPREVIDSAEPFLATLFRLDMIRLITVKDLEAELSERVLEEDEAVKMLRWMSTDRPSDLSVTAVRGLLKGAVVSITVPAEDGKGQISKVVTLGDIRTYVSNGGLFTDVDLPRHTIPFSISKQLSRKALVEFGWEDLQPAAWTRFVVDRINTKPAHIANSPAIATRVLTVLSRLWGSVSEQGRSEIVEILSSITCMPTTAEPVELKRPADTYFAHAAKGFEGLSVISADVSKLKDGFLKAIGVRVALDLKLLIDSLMALTSEDGQKLASIVRYLSTVESDIPEEDMEGLKSAEVWPASRFISKDSPPVNLEQRKRVGDLFEPTDENRLLGLPVIRWPVQRGYFGDYREMKFLRTLGIRTSPTRIDLMTAMVAAHADKSAPLYNACLDKLVGLSDRAGRLVNSIAYLPAADEPWPGQLFRPDRLFVHDGCRVFGYRLLRRDLVPAASRLKIAVHPPIEECVTRLLKTDRPTDHRDAVAKLDYMACRAGEMTSAVKAQLGSGEFVPIVNADGKVIRYAAPGIVVLGPPSELLADVVDFVDFGGSANYFLSVLGSKTEPSTADLATILINSPGLMLARAGPLGYLDQLRKLAANESDLRADKKLWALMKKSAFLLAYRDDYGNDNTGPAGESKSRTTDGGDDGDAGFDDEPVERKWHLMAPADVVLIGDSHRDFARFRNWLYAAPPDDSLERLYEMVGVRWLKELVEKDNRIGLAMPNQALAVRVHKQMVERSRVFLFEQDKARVRHDAGWVDKCVNVVVVDSIITHSTLRIGPHRNTSKTFREPLTALERSRPAIQICITPKLDLYHLSVALVRLLVRKPTQNDAIALEMILSTDLNRLRTKGYNVDRILRDQEAAAAARGRIADEENVRLRAENEQRRLGQEKNEQDKRRTQDRELAVAGPSSGARPPGAQPSILDQVMTALGHNTSAIPDVARIPPRPLPGASTETLPGGFPSSDSPPRRPTSSTRVRRRAGSNSGSSGSGTQEVQAVTTRPTGTGGPMTTRDLNRMLDLGLSMTRPTSDAAVHAAPSTKVIEGARTTYCDVSAGQDLVRKGSITSNRVPFYMPRDSTEEMLDRRENLAGELDVFGSMIVQLQHIVGVPIGCISVFWNDDPNTKTIAFNQSGAIFCNFKFWLVHEMDYDQAASWHYWYITLCHELAHNLVAEHNSDHGFFTESFIHRFFNPFMSKLLQRGIGFNVAA